MKHDLDCEPSRACSKYKAADWDSIHAHLATIYFISVFKGVDDREDARGRFNEIIYNLNYPCVQVKLLSNIINAQWFNYKYKYKRNRQTSHLR